VPAKQATLVTGASGFLGGLVTAALLAEERRVLLPVRDTRSANTTLDLIRCALLDRGFIEQDAHELLRLATIIELPPLERFQELTTIPEAVQIDEIVHCAGCVDYFDRRRLKAANIDLTSRLLEAAKIWSVRRFIFLSTSYCAGYRTDTVPEQLHPDPLPENEPTEYTRSKRIAEWNIASSGVPFVIIRPSVVIGDSRSGKYTGKNYGLYQMWRAIEGLLCREYAPVWSTVAPSVPVDFIHQDAFQDAFIGIYRLIQPNTIMHLVSDPAKRPTMRELCWLWADIYCPLEIHCYASVDDVPLPTIPIRQRRFLELAAKNLEIATHLWNFETTHLDKIRTAGVAFADVSLDTIAACQRKYIQGSLRIQEHMRQYARVSGTRPRPLLLDVPSAISRRRAMTPVRSRR
jgi:nucleoside-diphosphate-sugar epimerase